MFASGATATTPIRDGAVYTPDPSLIAAMQKFVDMGETSGKRQGRTEWIHKTNCHNG